MRRQLVESVQLPWKRNRVWGCIVQRGSGGKYSVGLQWGRRLLREQRGSMRLGQVLHGRCLRGSDCQRQFLPEQQSMFERKLFEQPLLRHRDGWMWKFLRFPVQQLELRELRPLLRRGLDLFGWHLLSRRWSDLLDRRSVSERRLQYLLS